MNRIRAIAANQLAYVVAPGVRVPGVVDGQLVKARSHQTGSTPPMLTALCNARDRR